MGTKEVFQPLTREDRVSVVIYRIGIVLSAVIVAVLALLAATSSPPGPAAVSPALDALIYGLYIAVGMSVFFIHLYIGKLKYYLKNLYFIGIGCLIVLLYVGKGSLSAVLLHQPFGPLLLLPLSGCLGFVTAKEAFCFKLIEGYLLAMIMPLYLLFLAAGALTPGARVSGLVLIAALLVFFTLRKAFMPLAYDIGDKTAYR